MIRRLLPHPGLTLLLILVWVLLTNSVSLNTLVLATLLGLLIPLATSRYWPDTPRLRSPTRLLAYASLVLWDVIVANFQVAWIILAFPPSRIKSAWITVPVDLPSPEALSLLAGTITLTPGTLTADVSADGRSLLVHALHAPDPEATREQIKSRYEARLKRIFT
ncbi:MAG: Na+/H+ antiporter subunit E [Paracoccaceae bacterium]